MTGKAGRRGKAQPRGSELLKLAVGAVGVVYGDIGTSPLYAIRECFSGSHSVTPSAANVLGIVSLVFWALALVIVLKYLTFIMRADHDGEGGILALLALAAPGDERGRRKRSQVPLVLLGLFGAALLYGDGIITPAISVVSAVEGLEVATPVFRPYVVPLAAVILILLFLAQKRGTGGIGAIFGPVMIVWFAAIAATGIPWILRHPQILAALDPRHALGFLLGHGLHGFLVLGAVVLCITGGEALYADLGHFGVRPIRLAWYAVAFPALLLNYFGQGALLLSQGAAAAGNPFYAMVPGPLLYPMVVLATAATVIASQALISGAFSLTSQAVQLGYLPRFRVVHTSGRHRRQIYIPQVNTLLMIACLALVIAFRRSTNMAGAYGIAVTGTMTITSILFFVAMRPRWGLPRTAALTALFLTFDLAFLGGNLAKIPYGGWFSILLALAIFAVMTTWKRGRRALARTIREATMPIEKFLADVDGAKPHRVKGTAVFLTLNPDIAPAALLHNFKHNKVLHEQVVILTLITARVPTVGRDRRVSVTDHGRGFFQVLGRYGFLERPNVPEVLALAASSGIDTRRDVSYYLSRETLIRTGRAGMSPWRTALFSFLSRNAQSATEAFGIPANRVVELGMQVET